jgi:hypothetical protein
MTGSLWPQTWQEVWNGEQNAEEVGAVYTKPEIVDLILDLADYRPEARRLAHTRVIEPSCGDGAFVLNVVRRIIRSEQLHPCDQGWVDPSLDDALRAVDINAASLDRAHRDIIDELARAGCTLERAEFLARTWLVHTDFLLAEWPRQFDLVCGNPPYVRIEALPRDVLAIYRQRYETLGDRADLYVAFIQRGLELLSSPGQLAYITANRFAKNLYGRGLRAFISRNYHVKCYINLEHTQPFQRDVSAYPAIIVIDREKDSPTQAATLSDITPATLDIIRGTGDSNGRTVSGIGREFKTWYPAGEPWITTDVDEHRLFSELRGSLPILEDSAPQTRVGIGVATGADSVFVLNEYQQDVEADRQIPLIMSADVSVSALSWSGHYLINPFRTEDDGALVDFREYPGLAAHFEKNAERLRARHVAKTRPTSWFRTIDRIWPLLQHQPKLLIPDIQGETTVGLDEGRYYPHHNLYYVSSAVWDLEALKALLRSSYVINQVRAYSVQMRGGSIRWQAQTLRRLRVPHFASLSPRIVSALAEVADNHDQRIVDEVAEEAFRTG